MAAENENILTLVFDKLDDVVLQYHPSSLTLNSSSFTSSVQGINNTITGVAKKETIGLSIGIQTYFTAILPKDINRTALATATSFAHGTITGLQAASSADARVLSFLDFGSNAASLARGVYDTTTGVISAFKPPITTRGLLDEQITKLKTIYKACKQTEPVRVYWDIANELIPQEKFYIKSFGLSAERIRDEDGKTMVISISLQLSKLGFEVRSANGS